MQASRRHNQQTIAWFNDLNKRGLLDMEPPYQRRSVWNQAYKDAFIDTVLLQYPAPAVFLYQEISPDGQTKMHLVDGKQRLTSLFEFVKGEFAVSEDAQITALRGLYFEQLPVDYKTAFWTYEFTVEYLPTNEEGLINGIFERINKNVAKLTRQELRHARFGGKFITLLEQLSEWMPKHLPENFPRFELQSRKQMKDVEFASSLALLVESGPSGQSQDDLDKAFSDRDLEWDRMDEVEETFRRIIHKISAISRYPVDYPLAKTRLRNQADFYSLFGSLLELSRVPDPALEEPDTVLAERLKRFVEAVDGGGAKSADAPELKYLNAAKSNSNDTGQRKQRIEIIKQVLRS